MPVVIDRFVGEYAFLSNFAAAKVTLDGETYMTVEHAFQAAKVNAVGPGSTTERWDHTAKRMLTVRWRDLIRAAHTPNKAKALGRQVPLRENWDAIKIEVMRELLLQKFAPGTAHLRRLLETEAPLVEGNTWHDNYWGNCTCCRPECRFPGQNNLGLLLMLVRATRKDERAEPSPAA